MDVPAFPCKQDSFTGFQSPSDLPVPGAASHRNGQRLASQNACSVFDGGFGVVVARFRIGAPAAGRIVSTANTAIVEVLAGAIVSDGLWAVVAGRFVCASQIWVASSNGQIKGIANIQSTACDCLTDQIVHHIDAVQDEALALRLPQPAVTVALDARSAQGSVHHGNRTCHAWTCERSAPRNCVSVTRRTTGQVHRFTRRAQVDGRRAVPGKCPHI